MPLFDMTEQNFLFHKEWDVFSYGRTPSRIDIMLEVKGLRFNEVYSQAIIFTIDNIKIKTVQLSHLIKAKKAAGRYKDLDDIEQLTNKNRATKKKPGSNQKS
jgi:predicted nucleotidyltransferase